MIRNRHKILVVDDDLAMRKLLSVVLSAQHDVGEAASGEEALETLSVWSPELILLDINMPGMDGYETCRRIKKMQLDNNPQIIMVSGKSEKRELMDAFDAGADDYLIKPVDRTELHSRVDLHFRLRASYHRTHELQCSVNEHHQQLKIAADARMRDILHVQDVAVFTLAKVAESRDNETGQHIVRMREYAQLIALELQANSIWGAQIDSQFLADLYRSAPLHDIGKVGIPDAILLKPGRLTDQEMTIMKQHAVIGADILQQAIEQSRVAGFLVMAEQIARHHHERWDGLGYPAGLKEDAIPLAARIVAVADVYDALTSKRPYKDAFPNDKAKTIIVEGARTQFDTVVVDAFLACYQEIEAMQAKHVDSPDLPPHWSSFGEYGNLEPLTC